MHRAGEVQGKRHRTLVCPKNQEPQAPPPPPRRTQSVQEDDQPETTTERVVNANTENEGVTLHIQTKAGLSRS